MNEDFNLLTKEILKYGEKITRVKTKLSKVSSPKEITEKLSLKKVKGSNLRLTFVNHMVYSIKAFSKFPVFFQPGFYALYRAADRT
ncbi:MAG: hypothetical protein U9Q67_02295, partial [Patescibacteria group bacterium]|nr:hypothetical protein [Patescibacteria group bacterium]